MKRFVSALFWKARKYSRFEEACEESLCRAIMRKPPFCNVPYREVLCEFHRIAREYNEMFVLKNRPANL